eukprot:scaffold55062_cov30-Tisochrysis_lutea.AAC.1
MIIGLLLPEHAARRNVRCRHLAPRHRVWWQIRRARHAHGAAELLWTTSLLDVVSDPTVVLGASAWSGAAAIPQGSPAKGGKARSPSRRIGSRSGTTQCKCRLPDSHRRHATTTSPGARSRTLNVRESGAPAKPCVDESSTPMCRTDRRGTPCTSLGSKPPQARPKGVPADGGIAQDGMRRAGWHHLTQHEGTPWERAAEARRPVVKAVASGTRPFQKSRRRRRISRDGGAAVLGLVEREHHLLPSLLAVR